MKPQIIVSEMPTGQHHRDADRTRTRLIKGASWKKQRTIVIVPSDLRVPAKAAFSWWNLYFPPNQGIYKMLAQGLEVGHAYTAAIEQVLANPELSQWEYLLTIEHDNLPAPDGLLRLIAQMEAHHELACISGLYFTKGEEGVAQIWGDPKEPIVNFRPQLPVTGQLVECCGTGMGFALWRLKMFKDARLKTPWFETVTKNGLGTQDLAFWADARKYGYRCAVDCAVTVGHYDADQDMVW